MDRAPHPLAALKRTVLTARRVLQRALQPLHPQLAELSAYLRFLHREEQENLILKHIGPPQPIEDFIDVLAEGRCEYVDTLIASDLHLGSSLSLVRAFDQALSRFSFQRLILNGDIFDHLRIEPHNLEEDHRALFQRLRALSHTHEVVWIAGNHDMELEKFLDGLKARREYEWRYRGKRYLAIHGDQFDAFYHRHPLLYRIGTGFYGMVQRIGGQASRGFCAFLKRKTKFYTKAVRFSVEGALRHAQEHEVDYVFCGHTHLMHIEERRGVGYYNSGGWMESPSHFITVNESGVRVHAFNEKGEYLGIRSPFACPSLVVDEPAEAVV